MVFVEMIFGELARIATRLTGSDFSAARGYVNIYLEKLKSEPRLAAPGCSAWAARRANDDKKLVKYPLTNYDCVTCLQVNHSPFTTIPSTQ